MEYICILRLRRSVLPLGNKGDRKVSIRLATSRLDKGRSEGQEGQHSEVKKVIITSRQQGRSEIDGQVNLSVYFGSFSTWIVLPSSFFSCAIFGYFETWSSILLAYWPAEIMIVMFVMVWWNEHRGGTSTTDWNQMMYFPIGSDDK
jgi:hypothetical protein